MKTSTLLLLGAAALGAGALALSGSGSAKPKDPCERIIEWIVATARRTVPGWVEPPGARAAVRQLCAAQPADVLKLAADCLDTVSTIPEAQEVCDPQIAAMLFGDASVGASLAAGKPLGPAPRATSPGQTATFTPSNGNGSGPTPSFKPSQRLVIQGEQINPAIIIQGILTSSRLPPKTQEAPSGGPPASTTSKRRIIGIVDGAEYNPAAFNGTAHEIPWRFFRGTLRDKIGKTMFADESIVDLPMAPTEQTGSVRPFQEDWNRLVRYLDNRERNNLNVDPRLADVRGLLVVNRGLLGQPTLSDDDKSTLRAIEIAGAVSDGIPDSPDWPALIKAIP